MWRRGEIYCGFWTESEEKVILVSENDLFLTLGLGTSSARNENLRPLLNTNIPLISGKYGLRNHFWPLESRFLMRKNEKKSIFSLGPNGPILQFFWFSTFTTDYIYTVQLYGRDCELVESTHWQAKTSPWLWKHLGSCFLLFLHTSKVQFQLFCFRWSCCSGP